MFTSAAVRRARWAVAGIFLANGIIIGTWAAHIPLVEERLGISHATLGIALLAMALGALLAMPLAGAIIARAGSARVTRIAMIALVVAFLLPLLAPNAPLLMLALFFFGASNGTLDIAMNAHGVMVERKLERPIMSSLHGMWSLGGLAGAGLAAVALPYVPAFAEAVVALAVAGAIALASLPFLLPTAADGGNVNTALALPSRATLGLGILCFLAMTSEGAVIDWSALHLKASVDAGPGLAATGFAAFSAAMAVGRFSGDWLRSRMGATTLVRGSAICATAGLFVAVLAPTPVLAVAGFCTAGLGIANLVPIFFGAAGHLPGQNSGTAIAALATMGYSGFLVGPPLIGFVASASSLAVGLGLVVLACLTIAISARAVEPAEPQAAARSA